MKVIDFLRIFQESGSPFVRIMDYDLDKAGATQKEAYITGEYFSKLTPPLDPPRIRPYYGCEVLAFKVTHEVRHKKYKERGLLPPFAPELTAEYEFTDIEQRTYYDIYISNQDALKVAAFEAGQEAHQETLLPAT